MLWSYAPFFCRKSIPHTTSGKWIQLFPRYGELIHSGRDSVSCDRAQRSPNQSLKGLPLTDLVPSDVEITSFLVQPLLGTIYRCQWGKSVHDQINEVYLSWQCDFYDLHRNTVALWGFFCTNVWLKMFYLFVFFFSFPCASVYFLWTKAHFYTFSQINIWKAFKLLYWTLYAVTTTSNCISALIHYFSVSS